MKRNDEVIIKLRNEKLLIATIKNIHKDGTMSAQISHPESTVAGFWVLLHEDGQATPYRGFGKQLALQVADRWYNRAANETLEWLNEHNEAVLAKARAEAEEYTKQFTRNEAERSIKSTMAMGTSKFFLENLKVTKRWTGNHDVLDFVSIAWEDGEAYRDVSGTIYTEQFDAINFSYQMKASIFISWQREDGQREERMWSGSYYSAGFSIDQARQMALCKCIR